MSAKIFGIVWELELAREEKYVLLALADHADHEGNNVFPSVALIAWKTGYSERQVQALMRRLETKGLLVKVEERFGRGHTVKYRINLEAGTLRESPRKGAKTSPITAPSLFRKGEIPQAERVQSITRKGELATAPESREPKAGTFPPKSPGVEILRHRSIEGLNDAAGFQIRLQRELELAGFETKREEFVVNRGDGSPGRIDLVAKRQDEVIAIECDREQPRSKSEIKLLGYPANRRWIVLRDPAVEFLNMRFFEDLIRCS